MADSIFNHPEYTRLLALEYGDIGEHHRIFVIYLDLIETKGWYNVKLCPVDRLKKVFVSGHATSTEELSLIWPVSSVATLSMHQMMSVMHDLQKDYSASKVLLGIVDSDSTVVYYCISNEMKPPDAPHQLQATKDKQRRRTRRRRLRQQQIVSRTNTAL